MKGCLKINYEPPDGLLLSGRFCVGAVAVGMLTKLPG